MSEENNKGLDKGLDLSTISLHGDRHFEEDKDVAPPLHVSTIFETGSNYSYSRSTQPTRARVEHLISQLEGGYAVCYSSGMSALMALLHTLCPKVIAFQKGYGGTKKGIDFYMKQNTSTKLINVDEINDTDEIDIIYIETPNNPYCLCSDIKHYAKIAEKKQAKLVVDSTFATPVSTKPIELGADFVLHSVTKYFGGHSDILGGVLVCKESGYSYKLMMDRVNLGNVMGSLESWLLLRSIRTLSLRYIHQSNSAKLIAKFLSKQTAVDKVWHPALKSHPSYNICKKQMKYPPACFSFEAISQAEAIFIFENTKLFIRATSLGGVESTIDWRYKHDDTVPKALLRLSIGVEDPQDLINDLTAVFQELAKVKSEDKLKDIPDT